jgi:EAL domain-containing protein (putative c-di-GMP-specific phosphodiesterase class I)
LARLLIETIGQTRFSWSGKIYDIRASIGLTAITSRSLPPTGLMSQVDVACHAAKVSGRNQAVLYSGKRGEAQRYHQQIQIASGIRDALESGRFELFAQEILTLDDTDAEACNVELLLRMRDASGRAVRPASFMPAAERYSLMGNLDRWVIKTALIDRGAELAAVPGLSVSINLSATSVNDPYFRPLLKDALARSALPANRVNFELTESSLIDNLSAASDFVAEMQAAGCGLILDDFGAGFSSFAFLRQFAVDGLKIDGSFVRELARSPVDRTIVESINDIAHKLGARTIAEFVEDWETLDIVREIGIDQAQGYVIGRPVSLNQLIKSGCGRGNKRLQRRLIDSEPSNAHL